MDTMVNSSHVWTVCVVESSIARIVAFSKLAYALQQYSRVRITRLTLCGQIFLNSGHCPGQHCIIFLTPFLHLSIHSFYKLANKIIQLMSIFVFGKYTSFPSVLINPFRWYFAIERLTVHYPLHNFHGQINPLCFSFLPESTTQAFSSVLLSKRCTLA